MGIESFIGERWSGKIQSSLQANLVFGAVCNKDFEGEVLGNDRVRIPIIGDNTSVTAYTPNSSTLTYGQIDGAPVFLDINCRYSANFYLDDVDAAQVVGDLVGPATQKMGYALANEMDVRIAGLYNQAQAVASLGTGTSAIAITSVNVVEYLGLVGQRLDEANVPEAGRWMIIPPWFKRKIELADISLNTANSGTIANGFAGNALGFNLYVSNNVVETTPASHTYARILAGYNGSITLAQQIAKVEQMRDKDDFKSYFRALNVYGVKVVRPNTLACLTATYTAEP